MTTDPFPLLLISAAYGYVFRLWWLDYKTRSAGGAAPGGIPGTTTAPTRAWIIAAIGALVILVGETWGEIALGVAAEQSDITVFFGVFTLLAALGEEIIFRGFLVIEDRGIAVRRWAVLGASLAFALIHPFLWTWDDSFELTLNLKGVFSTAVVFLSSLWFYHARFATWNPKHSLLPCFAAHVAKNLGVVLIKAWQGHVIGLW